MKYLIASKMTTTLVQVHLSRVAENRSRVIVWGGGRCRARRMGGGRHYYLLVTCPLSVVSPISHYEVSPWNGGTFYILRRGSTTQHKLAQTILFLIPYMKEKCQLTNIQLIMEECQQLGEAAFQETLDFSFR